MDNKRTVWILSHPRLKGAVTVLEEGDSRLSEVPVGTTLTKSTMFKNVWDFINEARYATPEGP